MKKLIILTAMAMSLVSITPAIAAPNQNANPNAFLAQHITACRTFMKEQVELGNMKKDAAKNCIKQMKSNNCPHYISETTCTLD